MSVKSKLMQLVAACVCTVETGLSDALPDHRSRRDPLAGVIDIATMLTED
jgi:hypothetical protein